MTTKHFDISQTVQLHITRCQGPLTIHGWDRSFVELETPSEELEATLENTTLTVMASQSCVIHCPHKTTVKIGLAEGYLSISNVDGTVTVGACHGPTLLRAIRSTVSLNQIDGGLRAYSIGGSLQAGRIGGDASLKSIEGAITVENVGSSLRVRHLGADLAVRSVGADLKTQNVTGSLEVKHVGGSLQARSVGGKLHAEAVGGNAQVQDMRGSLALGHVGGNLRASMLGGGMEIGSVGGDLYLNGPLAPEKNYQGNAGGNATLRLPLSTSASLELEAQGRIHVELPLAIQSQDEHHLVGTLGEGAAHVILIAGGNIRLIEWAGVETEATEWIDGLEKLAEEIERQVDEALRGMDFETISQEIESKTTWAEQKLESVDWERLGLEARRAAEAGIAQAREAIQKALARMEAWRGEHVSCGQPIPKRPKRDASPSQIQPSATPPAEPTDEERMAILRMIERGQITPEEGEMLLDALEK